jgi:hypothetical protein
MVSSWKDFLVSGIDLPIVGTISANLIDCWDPMLTIMWRRWHGETGSHHVAIQEEKPDILDSLTF